MMDEDDWTEINERIRAVDRKVDAMMAATEELQRWLSAQGPRIMGTRPAPCRRCAGCWNWKWEAHRCAHGMRARYCGIAPEYEGNMVEHQEHGWIRVFEVADGWYRASGGGGDG